MIIFAIRFFLNMNNTNITNEYFYSFDSCYLCSSFYVGFI